MDSNFEKKSNLIYAVLNGICKPAVLKLLEAALLNAIALEKV
jgi:hypothetical protein